jgi:hypothetical protein
MARLVAVLIALSLAWSAGPVEAQRQKAKQKAAKEKAAGRAVTKIRTTPRDGAEATGGLPRPQQQPQQQISVTSSVQQHPGLARQADKVTGEQLRAAQALVKQLEAGNTNPGIGSKHLFDGVHEARARNGARVYFRSKPGQIEVVGMSTKDNQDSVIRLLRGLFGKKSSSVEWRPAAEGVLELAQLAA